MILGGPPASGKSTLAGRLEAVLDAIRLSPDEWLDELGLDLRHDQSRDHVERLQSRLAEQLLRRGFVVILDWGVYTREKRNALRERARASGAAVELHFLDPPRAVLWQRIETRRAAGERSAPTRAQLDALLDELEVPDAVEQAGFDPPMCPNAGSG